MLVVGEGFDLVSFNFTPDELVLILEELPLPLHRLLLVFRLYFIFQGLDARTNQIYQILFLHLMFVVRAQRNELSAT